MIYQQTGVKLGTNISSTKQPLTRNRKYTWRNDRGDPDDFTSIGLCCGGSNGAEYGDAVRDGGRAEIQSPEKSILPSRSGRTRRRARGKNIRHYMIGLGHSRCKHKGPKGKEDLNLNLEQHLDLTVVE